MDLKALHDETLTQSPVAAAARGRWHDGKASSSASVLAILLEVRDGRPFIDDELFV